MKLMTMKQYSKMSKPSLIRKITKALKKIPNKTIKAKFGGLMYGLGVTCTLGLARFSVTKGVWNKVVEPYIIDAVDNIFVHGVSRFVEGLRSDNG